MPHRAAVRTCVELRVWPGETLCRETVIMVMDFCFIHFFFQTASYRMSCGVAVSRFGFILYSATYYLKKKKQKQKPNLYSISYIQKSANILQVPFDESSDIPT